MKVSYLSVLLALGLAVSPALAATNVGVLTGVVGKVLVDNGSGFVPVQDGYALKGGDIVMVGDDSQAMVNYSGSKCVMALVETSLSTIAAKAPCLKNVSTQSQGVFVKPVVGAAAGNSTFIIGGVAAAAAVGILGVVLLSGGDDDDDDNGVSGSAN